MLNIIVERVCLNKQFRR